MLKIGSGGGSTGGTGGAGNISWDIRTMKPEFPGAINRAVAVLPGRRILACFLTSEYQSAVDARMFSRLTLSFNLVDGVFLWLN